MNKIIALLVLFCISLSCWAKCDEMGRLAIVNTTSLPWVVTKLAAFEDSSNEGISLKDTLGSHNEFALTVCRPSGLFAKKKASGEIELQDKEQHSILLAYDFFQDSYHDGQVDVQVKVHLSNPKDYQVRINKLRTWDSYKPIAEIVIESYAQFSENLSTTR